MTAAACPETRTALSRDEAYAVLEPYFLAVQERFVPRFDKTRTVRFAILGEIHDKTRHFAAWDGRAILAAPELAELPEETVLAILSHEFGHATDFLYPGEYVLVDGEGIVTMPPTPQDTRKLDKRAAQALRARMHLWQERDGDTVERTADAIGESVIGRPIGYSGPCLLQTFERGMRPRPEGLR